MLSENKNVLQLLNQIQKDDLLKKLIQQINKDLQLVGVDYNLNENSTPKNVVINLKELLIDLINNKFSDYVNLLYRIDIPEKQIIELQGLELNILTEKVAILILRKEWQKVWFKNRNL